MFSGNDRLSYATEVVHSFRMTMGCGIRAALNAESGERRLVYGSFGSKQASLLY